MQSQRFGIPRSAPIGTSATRANVLDILKKRGYLVTEKNKLHVSEAGITLCKAVELEPLLTSPEMTAKWEQALQQISTEERTPDNFLNQIKKFVAKLIADVPTQRATVGEATAPGDRLHAAARIHDLLRKTKILHGRGGTVLHEHRVGGNMAAFRQVPPHRFGFGHHFVAPLSAGGDEHARLALLLPQWPPPAAPATTPTSCRNSFRPSPPVIVFSTMR